MQSHEHRRLFALAGDSIVEFKELLRRRHFGDSDIGWPVHTKLRELGCIYQELVIFGI